MPPAGHHPKLCHPACPACPERSEVTIWFPGSHGTAFVPWACSFCESRVPNRSTRSASIPAGLAHVACNHGTLVVPWVCSLLILRVPLVPPVPSIAREA